MRTMAAACVAAGLLVATGGFAPRQTQSHDPGYPTPEEVGFHHCALIYERPQRGVSDLTPYVARVKDGEPREWLFDAFLFLRFSMPNGVRTDEGPTDWSDWLMHLDDWFAPGRDLRALEEAIDRCAAKLGEPPGPRMIMLSIPYPSRAMERFGPLPDGSVVDLGSEAGVDRAVSAYVAEAARRFREAGFQRLRLWGFYWMREEVSPQDEPRVRAAARAVHEPGYRFSWIPWWRAPGFDRWRECGFDMAILQPNYAFASWHHGGAVRRNRLQVAADLARRYGLGIEIEAGDLVQSLADRQAFAHYLADGAPGRLGYQNAACAYYLGTEMVERLATAREEHLARLYDALADFVTGRAVREVDPPQTWREVGTGFVGRFPRPTPISALDIFFEERPDRPAWTGRVEVVDRSNPKGGAAGWAIRISRQPENGPHQVITVPVRAQCRTLEVRLRPDRPGMRLARAKLLAGNVGPEGYVLHAALGCPYTTDVPARRSYDDPGNALTDGVIPERGFLDRKSVGWLSSRAAIAFDLGRVARVTSVEVFCQGGSFGAVHWPTDAMALLSAGKRPPLEPAGVGHLPDDLRILRPAPVEITKRRSPTDMDGVLRFRTTEGIGARYVHILLGGSGWLMVSEVRILSGEENVARRPGVRYVLRPLPSPDESASPYADDGVRLTDGVVARTFSRREVVGWDDGLPKTVALDLGMPRRLSGMVVWSLRGGNAAVYAPERVTVEASEDGAAWKPTGETGRGAWTEDGRVCEPAPYRITFGAPKRARFLRLRVHPARGWCMLSELEVTAADR